MWWILEAHPIVLIMLQDINVSNRHTVNLNLYNIICQLYHNKILKKKKINYQQKEKEKKNYVSLFGYFARGFKMFHLLKISHNGPP